MSNKYNSDDLFDINDKKIIRSVFRGLFVSRIRLLAILLLTEFLLNVFREQIGLTFENIVAITYVVTLVWLVQSGFKVITTKIECDVYFNTEQKLKKAMKYIPSVGSKVVLSLLLFLLYCLMILVPASLLTLTYLGLLSIDNFMVTAFFNSITVKIICLFLTIICSLLLHNRLVNKTTISNMIKKENYFTVSEYNLYIFDASIRQCSEVLEYIPKAYDFKSVIVRCEVELPDSQIKINTRIFNLKVESSDNSVPTPFGYKGKTEIKNIHMNEKGYLCITYSCPDVLRVYYNDDKTFYWIPTIEDKKIREIEGTLS